MEGWGEGLSPRSWCQSRDEMMGFAKSFKLAGILGLVDLEFLSLSDANYDEIGGYQNPKGVIADYRNFDKDSHDRDKK